VSLIRYTLALHFLLSHCLSVLCFVGNLTCEKASFFVCPWTYRHLIFYVFSVVVHQAGMFHSGFNEKNTMRFFILRKESLLQRSRLATSFCVAFIIWLPYVKRIGQELHYSVVSSGHCTTRIYKYTPILWRRLHALWGVLFAAKTTMTSFGNSVCYTK